MANRFKKSEVELLNNYSFEELVGFASNLNDYILENFADLTKLSGVLDHISGQLWKNGQRKLIVSKTPFDPRSATNMIVQYTPQPKKIKGWNKSRYMTITNPDGSVGFKKVNRHNRNKFGKYGGCYNSSKSI